MKNTKGFSLAEMLVVVAILGMIVAFGLPAFQNYLQSYKLRSSANQIVNDLRAVRQTATTENIPMKISFDVDTDNPSIDTYNMYWVYRYNMTPGTPLPTDANLKTAANWNLATNAAGLTFERAVSGRTAPEKRVLHLTIPTDDDPANNYIADLDSDNLRDIIFLPDGTVFNDGNNIKFNEDSNSPLNNKPHLVIQTEWRKVKFRQYVIYVTYVGKISAVAR